MKSKSLPRQFCRNLPIISNHNNSKARTHRTSRTRASRRGKIFLFSQSFDRQDAASGDCHYPARLCFFRVVEITNVLADDFDIGGIPHKPDVQGIGNFNLPDGTTGVPGAGIAGTFPMMTVWRGGQ